MTWIETEEDVYRERIAGFPKKLERARGVPGSDAWFGVSNHQFRLRPRLAESQVDAFEQSHGISLPEDYREFLLRAGDGGAGPYYGIAALAEWDQWFEEEAESPGFLKLPCPLVDGDSTRAAWLAAQKRDRRMSQGIVHPGATPVESWRQFLVPDWSEWGKGTIHICDQGCTYSARLIVSGEARGRVVYLDAQQWYPAYFVRDRNFIDWYERWLDGVTAGQTMEYFGFDNPAYNT